MVESSAPRVRARWQLALPVFVSLALGCSFEDHPSLGRLERVESAAGHSPVHIGAGNGATVEPGADAGSANLTGAAGAAASLDGGADDASNASPADAGLSSRDAAPVAPQDPPDAGPNASCAAGTYLGSFSCSIDANSLLGLPTTTMAQAPLYLRSSAQNALQVAASSLVFQFNGFTITADLSGKLDCATGAFHADWVNGMFAPTVVPLPTELTGALDGTLDPATKRLSGSWSFAAYDGTTCKGAWDAGLQP